eukprot:scaffold8417_cov582-Pinguiococcus_pyrenoidosus.AAC.1
MELATSSFLRFRLLRRLLETGALGTACPASASSNEARIAWLCRFSAFLSMSLMNLSSRMRFKPGTRSVRSRAKRAAALQCGRLNMARSMLTSWRTKLGNTTEITRIRSGISSTAVKISAIKKLRNQARAT